MVTLQILKRLKARLAPIVYNCMLQKSEPAYVELHVLLLCCKNNINSPLYKVTYCDGDNTLGCATIST